MHLPVAKHPPSAEAAPTTRSLGSGNGGGDHGRHAPRPNHAMARGLPQGGGRSRIIYGGWGGGIPDPPGAAQADRFAAVETLTERAGGGSSTSAVRGCKRLRVAAGEPIDTPDVRKGGGTRRLCRRGKATGTENTRLN